MKILGMVVFLLGFFPASAPGYYAWSADEGLQQWGLSNVSGASPAQEGVRVFKQPGSNNFSIATKHTLDGNEYAVKAVMRTMETNALVTCMLSAGNETISLTLPLVSGRSWKEYAFDFKDKIAGNPRVNGVVFVFEYTDSVEIREIILDSPSFSDFFIPQGFRENQINFLAPFTLYGHSLNYWLYALIVLCSLCIAVYALLRRQKVRPVFFGVLFLGCFMLQDIRGAYEYLVIMKTTYEDFLSAPPGEKRFHFKSDLVELAAFIKQNLPRGEDTVYLYVYDDYLLYLKYLLFPLKMIPNSETMGRVNVFYVPSYKFERNTIMVDGKPFFFKGKVLAYSRDAFMYIAE